MLSIRGRLITPFVLGPMSVGLNILICHLFTDISTLYTTIPHDKLKSKLKENYQLVFLPQEW